MPDSGNDHGAASHGSGGGADYAGRHAASSGTLQGLTLSGPSHPCHAAFLPSRLSATPPFRGSEQEQPHADTARGTNGAFDSRQIDAPPRHVLTQRAEPPCADAFLSCRLSAMPSLESLAPTFRADDWIHLANAHVPARSGREQIHARERASGAASHTNRGIGRGYALGTELAQADFRESTCVCQSTSCAALMDEHWVRRSGHTRCGWCRGCRGNIGKHIRYQLAMAHALENGDRRLVSWVVHDAYLTPYTLPLEAVTLAVAEARMRVGHMQAHPPRRGRPPASRPAALTAAPAMPGLPPPSPPSSPPPSPLPEPRPFASLAFDMSVRPAFEARMAAYAPATDAQSVIPSWELSPEMLAAILALPGPPPPPSSPPPSQPVRAALTVLTPIVLTQPVLTLAPAPYVMLRLRVQRTSPYTDTSH